MPAEGKGLGPSLGTKSLGASFQSVHTVLSMCVAFRFQNMS